MADQRFEHQTITRGERFSFEVAQLPARISLKSSLINARGRKATTRAIYGFEISVDKQILFVDADGKLLDGIEPVSITDLPDTGRFPQDLRSRMSASLRVGVSETKGCICIQNAGANIKVSIVPDQARQSSVVIDRVFKQRNTFSCGYEGPRKVYCRNRAL